MDQTWEQPPQAERDGEVERCADDGCCDAVRGQAAQTRSVLCPVCLRDEPRHDTEDSEIGQARVGEESSRRQPGSVEFRTKSVEEEPRGSIPSGGQ